MAEISRAKLFGKLNSIGFKSLEGATVFCKLRGNPYVELAHFLQQVFQLQDSDLHKICRHFMINPSKLVADLTASLDRMPKGATSISDISSHIESMTERAWVYATLLYGEGQIRTGHLVVALAKEKTLRNILLGISREFEKIKPEELSDSFAKIVAGSPEDVLGAQDALAVGAAGAPGEASGAMAPAQMGKQEALKRFCKDLTADARSGKMDPIIGRDPEIRQIVDILMRRRQNNPILTGEAGVGKTAVVEGFAQRIVAGDIPPSLKDVSVLNLDLGLLQAGASMKGEFENRLRQLIEEVQASPKPIILFVDEAHNLIGAGGAAGSGDAANLLKPALARGTLRTIAATTWAEYKKYIEKDPALTRRFQVVKVDEPTEEKCVLMMRAIASMVEKHHKVLVLDEALEAVVKLSHRYIPGRQLPDKAVSLLDTACARVAVSQHATPPEIEDLQHHLAALETELGIIDREEAVGVMHKERRPEVIASMEADKKRLDVLMERWNKEKDLVNKILDLRGKLREHPTGTIEGSKTELGKKADELAKKVDIQATPATQPKPLSEEERKKLFDELQAIQKQLIELQGETPLILPSVEASAVAAVVSDWTGIPLGRMVKDEMAAVLRLADTMGERVIGQKHALETIAKRMKTSRAGFDNPNRPIGVFMLAGPSGVGKTETALALAEALYGGEDNVITINMSEFQEAHTVSTLKGAPPGYVGYGEGGVLTEAVRRRPYSIVLLDEVEKAHPDVHEIFFQVFDKGWMEDGEGRYIDFKNTIILLTTNVGTELIMNMCKDPSLMPDPDALTKALREPMLKKFPPALLGRLVVVPYYPISDEVLRLIIKLQLGRIRKRLAENRRIPFGYDESVVDLVKSRCTEVESGARAVDAILTHTLLPAISEKYLTEVIEGREIKKVHVGVADSDFKFEFA
ncbi:MAG: type VI secretion system ATPase TssH [Planctomycetes bacterium]|nr:type VI secretion system ATPase TssH [Planctomycetota bacterium]